MMDSLTIGKALCLLGVLIFGMVSLSGMTGGRGLDSKEELPAARGYLWYFMIGALVAEAMGLFLLYSVLGRLPSTWLDGLVFTGWLSGALAVAFGANRAHPVVRSPLAGVAFLAGTLVFAVGPSSTGTFPLPTVALNGVLCLASASLLAMAALAFRRLLRFPDSGKSAVLLALLGSGVALFAGWGGGALEPRLFSAMDSVTGGPAEAVVILRDLIGAQTYTRMMPVWVGDEFFSFMRLLALGLVGASLLFLILEEWVGTPFYKFGLVFSLLGSSLVQLVFLCALGWMLAGQGVPIEVAPEELLVWLQAFAEERAVEPPLVVESVSIATSSPLRVTFSSAPGPWLSLVATVPLVVIASAYRLRALLSPVRNQEAKAEARRLELAERSVGTATLFLITVALVGGGIWSVWRWGAVEFGDPRALLLIAGWVVAFFHLVMTAIPGSLGRSPMILGVVGGVIGLLILVGPALGWTIPSIYPPFDLISGGGG